MQGLAAVKTLSSASKTDGSNKVGAVSLVEGVWDERPPPAPLLKTKLGRLPSMAKPSHVQIQPQAILSRQISERLSLSDRVSSSGSRSGQESTSLSLATMLYGFMDDDCEYGKCGLARCDCRDDRCDDGEWFCEVIEDEKSPAIESSKLDELKALVSKTGPAEQKLREAIGTLIRTHKESASPLYGSDGMKGTDGGIEYFVVQNLLRLGYNAGLCKSKWDPVEKQPGGEYEYIEVTLEYPWKPEMRLIVDLEFRGHFEIARPTREYRKMLKLLPCIFVGSSENLRGIVTTMCEAAKTSLFKRELHLPPWRKSSYILAKWFSPFVRISVESAAPSSSSKPLPEMARDSDSGRMKARFVTEDMRKTENEASRESQECKLSGLESRGVSWTENDWMERNDIGWKPPFVEPRRFQKSKKMAGLAAALRQSEVLLREQKTEHRHFSSEMNVLKQRHEVEHAVGISNRSRPLNTNSNSRTSVYSRGFTKGF